MKRSAKSDDGSAPRKKGPKVQRHGHFLAESESTSNSDAFESKIPAKIVHAKDLELGGNVLAASGDVDKSTASLGSPATASLKRFPDRLYELLNIEAAPESLYWLPGGKAFAIEQENFSSQVLDRYFQATKFSSFVRRLHKWGFRRETRGFRKEIGPKFSRSVIAFCHDQFQKDAPQLVEQMEEVAKKQSSTGGGREGTPSKAARRRSDESTSSDRSKTKVASPRSPTKKAANKSAPPGLDHSSRKENPYTLTSSTEAAFARAAGAVGAGAGTGTSVAEGNAQQQEQGALLRSIDQQLLLNNLRSSALQNQEVDTARLEILLRHQQQNESLLQRNMINASLAQQQQIQLQQQRAALFAAASAPNQALLDAATRERYLQLARSLSQGPLPQSQASGASSSLWAQIDNTRFSQVPRENNSQLVETLFLLELQRQQQSNQGQPGQQGEPGQPGQQNRQFPPFG